MLKNMVWKQWVFVCVVFLLIVISIVSQALDWSISWKRSSEDDIFGTTSVVVLFVPIMLPYGVSVIALLHSGYCCLVPPDSAVSRRLHYVLTGLSMLVILAYELVALDTIICAFNLRLIIVESIISLSYLVACISVILDLIGTRIKNKQLKTVE